MIVIVFMRVWLSSSWCSGWLYRLSATFWFSSLWCGVYLCLGNSDKQTIYDQRQEIKSMIINMVQNWNHMYFSHNSNIKYIGSTIKCIESIRYAINLDVVSFFMIFSDFDFMFLSMYY